MANEEENSDDSGLVERSWEFLDTISEKVEKFFSANDKQNILNIGYEMLRSGVQYIHVVVVGQNSAAKIGEEKRKARQRELEESIRANASQSK